MALVTKAQIASALTQRFADRIANQINRTVLLAQLVPVKNDRGQGQNVQWVARFGTAKGAAIADGADVSTFNNDDKVPAVLQFAVHHDAFKLTGLARAVANAAGNPDELSDLFMDEMGDSVERQAKGISEQLYLGDGGTSPQKIHGLTPASGVAAIGDTGVYATIDRSVFPQWQASVLDATAFSAGNTLGSFSYRESEQAVPAGSNQDIPEGIKMMRRLRRDIYTASSKKPDVIVTTPTLHEAYGLAVHKERRWMDQIRTGRGLIQLDAGYNVLEFDGIPMIEDIDCPAGEMLFLNSMELEIRQLPDRADRVNRATGMVQLAGTPDEHLGMGRTKLEARVQPLDVKGDAFPYALYSYLQLANKQCNAHGRITGLTE